MKRRLLFLIASFSLSILLYLGTSLFIDYSVYGQDQLSICYGAEVESILANTNSVVTGDNLRNESEKIGNAGLQCKEDGRLVLARQLIMSALARAQAAQAWDLTSKWQWQLAQIYREEKDRENTVRFYEAALQSATAFIDYFYLPGRNNDSYEQQYEQVYSSSEKLYRDYADYLLSSKWANQDSLRRAREVIASFQTLELVNFLEEPCGSINLEQIEQVVDQRESSTAFIFPIILEDRLEVIAQLPGIELKRERYVSNNEEGKSTRDKITEELLSFQRNLEEPYTFTAVKNQGQQVYSWLIEPFQEYLKELDVRTLVFFLDDVLRTIPIAALYDGEHYLVEHYAIASVIGMQVADPTPLPSRKLKVLAAGTSKIPHGQQEGFQPLQYVNRQLDEIEYSDAASEVLRDDDFNQSSFNTTINSSRFDIVHLITHGEFSDEEKSTFILTSQERVNVEAFRNLFQIRGQIRPDRIALLLLSACETATGRGSDTLGIAGASVRAGADSSIASLWSIDELSNVLFVRELYKHLGQPNVSRAEALRRAQVTLLKEYPFYSHPRYWAAYILVGDWL